MKTTNKIMATAIALAVGLSAASAATTTNDWFKVNFESGYTANKAITNTVPLPTDGKWTSIGNDASIMTNDVANSKKFGKLDTQGGSLIWTPTNAVGKVVILDADVYIVGSEDAPAISGGIVQTEVFLTNGVTSALCAHVGDGGTGSKWVELEGEPITDKTWIHLRIAIDYDQAPPQLSFQVNGKLMDEAGGSAATSFPVVFAATYKTKVESVSFMGTGYLDNFVGKTVNAVPSVNVGDLYVDPEGAVTENDEDLSVAGSMVTATFATSTGDGSIRYVQITGADGYVRTVRTTGGTATFNTANLPAGTYSITAFYGDAPSLAAGTTAPVAATIGANKAAEVAGGNISFTVKPISGLYYTLFAGETLGTLKAAAGSVLATPANEDAGGFITLTMPVPTKSNDVKVIKIYASDDPYAKNAAAPTN